jgi:hypothetical protein
MSRRVAILSSLGVVVAGLWISHSFGWEALHVRAATRSTTASWLPIHLKDGVTLWLNLHDDEMLENVEPEPFPDGSAGLVQQWFRQAQAASAENRAEWPAWLNPYPDAEQITESSTPWAIITTSERRGVVARSYRTSISAELVIEHYRRELERQGIAVTGQTKTRGGMSGLHGESSDQRRSVEIESHSGGYSVSYLVKEFGRYTPPPNPPALDLTLASVDEAGKVVRLRNRADGEILRLPFACLASDDDYKKMHEVRAAKRPDFLPPYPGATEILPPMEDSGMLNIAFEVNQQSPSRIGAFYKRFVEQAGFKIESENSGVETGQPYAGFQALTSDGARVAFTAFQSAGDTHAQVMYFPRR